MPIKLDNMLGIHEQALSLRERRTEVLSSNLANADTPNYKARDIDFKAALAEQQDASAATMKTTHASHIAADGGADGELLYRIPNQPSIDGNTVDPEKEKSAYMENALQYQATLRFVDGRLRSLKSAFRGE